MFIGETKLDFDDVLLVPQRSEAASRKEVKLERFFKFYHSPRTWTGIPVMAANMYATGSLRMSYALSAHKMVTCLHKFQKWDKLLDDYRYLAENDLISNTKYSEYAWLSIGIKDAEILHRVVQTAGVVPNICIDVANGYTDNFVKFCASIREQYSDPVIMAGNVCTPEQVQELIMHGGVDIVKVGIGPGSVCETRRVTGVGYPQLSAIAECAQTANGIKKKGEEGRLGLICADGGCRTPGDVCKAFAANADFVMLGGMFAGCDECDGEWQYEYVPKTIIGRKTSIRDHTKMQENKKSLKFYGMSSKEAQETHGDGLQEYRASEGKCMEVPYKGPVKDVVQEICGGLRSCCAYIGATDIASMSNCARFIRVNRIHQGY